MALTGVLLYTASVLPPFGDPANPANNEVPVKYIEEGVQDTGALNVVAGMIFDYRAFDTFGEACVLFAAVCAVLLLLRRDDSPDAFDAFLREMEEPRQNIILKNVAFLLIAMIMIFGWYIILNGHLSPGGGFSGGAVLGAALILYASAYGTKRMPTFFSYKVCCRIMSGSLIFYILAKGYSFFTGANNIPSIIPLGTPGSLFSAGLIPPLNIAVGLIVACTVYIIYILFSRGELK
jgi:multicomponent Na+:H+ antiporter subunit B